MKTFILVFATLIAFASCKKEEIPIIEEEAFVPKYDTTYNCEYVGGVHDQQSATIYVKSVSEDHPNYPIVLVVEPYYRAGDGQSDEVYITMNEDENGFTIPNQKVFAYTGSDSIINASVTFDNSISITFTTKRLDLNTTDIYTISSH